MGFNFMANKALCTYVYSETISTKTKQKILADTI